MSVAEASNEACLLEITEEIKIISREQDSPIATQGIGYWENTEIEIGEIDMVTLISRLKSNSGYSADSENGELIYSQNQPGKYRKSCRLDIRNNVLKFNLTLW